MNGWEYGRSNTHTSIIFFLSEWMFCVYTEKKCGGDDYIKKKTWKTVSERCQRKKFRWNSLFRFYFFIHHDLLWPTCSFRRLRLASKFRFFGFIDQNIHTHINTKHMHIAYILKPIHYRSNKIRFPFIVCLPLLWIGPRTR